MNSDPSNPKVCISQSGISRMGEEKRVVERIVLKYFPIAEYFHVAFVVSQNRVDVYLNGKLNVTRIFKGSVPIENVNTLPINFFQGNPIHGNLSNFQYFDSELSVKRVKELYDISKIPSEMQAQSKVNEFVDTSCDF